MSEQLTQRDVRDEAFREYSYPSGRVYRIENPATLFTRPGGTTHRVVDAAGLVHCVTFPGPDHDVVLRWKPKDAANPVQF